MTQFRNAGMAAAVLVVCFTGGCKSSGPAPGPAATAQQRSAAEQQAQPMTGAPVSMNPGGGGGCPAGSQLQSDGTCTGATAATSAPALTDAEGAPAASPSSAVQGSASQTSAPAGGPAPAAMPAIPFGTRLAVRMAQTLTTRDAATGQSFSGTLATPVVVSGTEVLHRGDRVTGTVVESKSPGKFKGEGVLSIRVNQVGGMPLRTTAYTEIVKGKGKRTAGFIGGGTGLGAILGGIADGGKGAAIGALAGAGAGTVGGAATDNKEVEIPAESVVTFRTALRR